MLVLVLAVLTVSYASSLRAYLQQRSHIGDLKAQIAEREASINDLEREKKRWDDPAYVKAQARARFGYLMPGESGFEVIGADGKPLEAQASLNDPSDVIKTVPKAWWTAAWESVELAGNPPPPESEPADLVDGSQRVSATIDPDDVAAIQGQLDRRPAASTRSATGARAATPTW